MRTAYLLAAALLLSSCASEQPTLTTPTALFAQAIDSSPALTPQPPLLGKGGKAKFYGPVNITYQLGNGNSVTPTATDARKSGQRQGSAATGQDASASNASKRSGGSSPWWYVLAAVGGAVGWEVGSRQLVKWLPWLARPG